MPIRKVPAEQGKIFHICNRGALKMTLFFNEYMYELFLQLLHVYAERYNITILSVCLMPNHVHILIRVEEGGDVPNFVRVVCSTYSKRINYHLHRSGTIFQGRYYMKKVTTDRYLKNVIRYIHLNPFKAGLVSHPAEWTYSDFQEAILQRDHIKSDHAFVRDVFGGAGWYESFVIDNMYKNYIEDPDLARDLAELGLV
jgi:putative transposase